MCTCGECTISQQNRVIRTSACGCLNWAVSISFVRTFQEVTSELPGRPARILKESERIYTRYFGRHGALLLIIISFVTSKQTQSLVWSQRTVCTVLFLMALVWSQRAVCTVLFLMAELYRCPSAVDDVREGVIVRAGSALPSVCMGCTIYWLPCAII